MSARELSRAEVMQRLSSANLSQQEAARLLRLSVRQVKRLWRAYRRDGARGLVSRRRGRPSNNRLKPEFVAQVVGLVKRCYPDFGPTLAREKLAERHGLHLGLETLRQLMIANGLWTSRKQRKIIVHTLRQRRACLGELIQIDGSPHTWFEDRGPRCTLLVFVDDATSQLMHLQFVTSESTAAYFAATKAYLLRYGKPLAFYSDRFSVFRVSDHGIPNGKTQFARALAELDIELICAQSPQAKGRVERANQTLQDRLIKELRLAEIDDLKEANAFLPQFMTDYNHRFAKAPLSPHNMHRPLSPADNLNRCLTLMSQRTVSKNLTVQYNNATFQLLKPLRRLRYATVQIRESRTGTITIEHQGSRLPFTMTPVARQPVLDRKAITEHVAKPRTTYKPPANHPWRIAGVSKLRQKYPGEAFT
ncbi:MAG: ISNCY family transposase [Candidatus Eremiobacteraeota bacterium]|nr:ISNCY family transposase [Candidatus Eremiobacteraeota bacterium]MBV8339364.1 ISNCY family transposase [Candidatus Eremiobacteraeota bacterium]MBV8596885.1 ISNCY family transposase [Candidatus Eremiobacteraeota bacterium]